VIGDVDYQSCLRFMARLLFAIGVIVEWIDGSTSAGYEVAGDMLRCKENGSECQLSSGYMAVPVILYN
jgi:hypothetical protein